MDSQNTTVDIKSHRSGQSVENIYIALVDEFGAIIGTDSSSSATLLVSSTNSSSLFVPILTGITYVKAEKGTFNFTDIVFTAQPGSWTSE